MLDTDHTPANWSRQLDLDVIYSIPDPFDTMEAWERFTHRDLKGLSRSALVAELARLRHRLLLDQKPVPWVVERFRVLRATLREG